MRPIDRRRFLQSVAVSVAAAGHAPFARADSPSSLRSLKQLPTIPWGAVYFRKSNPPKKDWEANYQQAAADGMNCFRHWFFVPVPLF